MTANHAHRDTCAIVGIGTTAFSRDSGQTELSLATEASLQAIQDAGLRPEEIDGIVRCDMDLVSHHALAGSLGLPKLTYWGSCGPGGVAPPAMIAQAVGAISTGQASNVLVFRSLNGRSGRRFGAGFPTSGDHKVGGGISFDEYFMPYGLVTPGQMFALMAQRHMQDFGTTSDDLASIALACRERANANPNAQMRDRSLTRDDYHASRPISEPLKLYDFCLETDGACAVVVTNRERAKSAPALIRAVAQANDREIVGGECFPSLLKESITTLPSALVAQELYRRAGIGPSDIDVAQLYDCFTITVLIQLEDYGFVEKGEGGKFASNGEIGMNGSLPINTGGGHLSEGYIHGMNHIVEGVRQIRGESTSQVPNAEICLVTASPTPDTSALILRRDPDA